MKEGKSLNYISKTTLINKSTLYYYYKKLVGKKYQDVEIDPKDESFIGELIGLFIGDGYCFFDPKSYQYSIRFFFNNSEKSYVKEVFNLLSQGFNKKPCMYRTGNVLIIRYYSKKLFNFILDYVDWKTSRNKGGQNRKSRTVFLKRWDYTREFRIGFLRGFIDSDGYLSSKKIVFASASKKMMMEVNEFLKDLGFESFKLSFYPDKRSNRIGMWHIYVHKSERERFLEMIKPRNLVELKDAPAGI